MTKSKFIGNRLISLLLALAMIALFIPAVSVTAAASGVPTLHEGVPKYGWGIPWHEPWYWDGQTLYLYGNHSYSFDPGDEDACYFVIESSNPTVMVSNSISVDLGSSNVFVYSENDITVKGAGMIAATGTGTLFRSKGSIDYYGGAISSDDALTVIDASRINYCNGQVNAPHGIFSSPNILIIDGYIALDSMTVNGDFVNVDIYRGFLDLQTLMPRKTGTASTYNYRDCVIRSQDASSDITNSDNGSLYLSCDKNNSVVYLPKMDNIDWLGQNLSNVAAKEQVACGGYVFCNQILTDADRDTDSHLRGGANGVGTELQGVFYYSSDSAAGSLYLDNLNFNNSGSLFISDYSLYASGVTAEEATLAVIPHSRSFGGAYFDDYNSYNSCSNSYRFCTIAAAPDESSIMCNLSVDSIGVKNCNVYLGTSDYLGVKYRFDSATPDPDTANSYYAPNGIVQMFDQLSLNRYADITAKKFDFSKSYNGDTPVICGNVYADEYTAINGTLIFDGSGAYDVCINNVSCDLEFSSSLGYIHEYKDQAWSYYSPSQSSGSNITYSGKNPIYAGKRVLSPIAGNAEYNDPLTVSPGLPGKVTIPLTYPFVNGAAKMEIPVFDEDGNSLEWSDIGVNVTIPDSTGKTSLPLVLTATENAKAGTYFFYFNLNGVAVQLQSGPSEIYFKVSETNSHTMVFAGYTSGWPYIDSNYNLQTFTAADYTGSVDADTWSWDGSTKTLTLKNSGSFVTTSGTGIIIAGNATVNVKSDWKISAGNTAIYSINGNLTINGADDGQDMYRLTTNAGISSDYTLTINHLYVDVLPESAHRGDLLRASTVDLNECELTANDNWNGNYAINASSKFILRRGVVLDVPASELYCGYEAYIADVDSADNLKLRTGTEIAAGSAYEIDNSNPSVPADSLLPIDDTKRIKLSTKKFTVNSDNAVMYDETVSSLDGEIPEYKLMGGKQYSLDLSQFISIDYNACDLTITSASDTMFAGEYFTNVVKLDNDSDGRPLLVADIPNSAMNDTKAITIGVLDNKLEYSSNKTQNFVVTIGGVTATDKIGFYHEGNYDMPATDHYTVSAEYNGTPLEKSGEYYIVPSGEYFDITLMPNDGYIFDIIKYGTGENVNKWEKQDISPNGTYHLPASGDATVYIGLNKSSDTQYATIELSAELQKSLASGEISSVTVKFSNGMEKTFDSKSADHSVKVLNGADVTVSLAVPANSTVTGINGVKPDISSTDGTYYTTLTINNDTNLTAEIKSSSELCSLDISAHNISDPGDKMTVKTAPVNNRGEYEIGTECEIVATVTADKFIGSVTFNGDAIEPDSVESDGCHYKVTLAAGVNEFDVTYVDISKLTIPKPANGTVTFSGRLDGGRSVTTLSDGTQVYSIGSFDTVTLTLTPDPGYQLSSAKLNGSEAAVTNSTCSFKMEQLADWTFTAEFEEIPANSFTVTVKSGANGTVTPGTAAYESGTKVTLTVTPDTGYQVKSVTMNGKAVTLTNGKYTFTVTADCVFEAEFEKKTSGGSTGGSSGSHSRPSRTETTESNPLINGTEKSWSDIASDLGKLSENSSVKISLNGNTTVPADVIRAIMEKKLRVEFVVDSVKSWIVNGAKLGAASSADLSSLPGNADRSALRGILGTDLKVTGTGVPADLKLNFRKELAGQFANVYKLVDKKLVFQGCTKVSEDGSVTISGANAAGEYVVMVSEYSDILGDADNNGVVNALDASVILKYGVGIEMAIDLPVCDVNSDSNVNSLDASAILKMCIGVAG